MKDTIIQITSLDKYRLDSKLGNYQLIELISQQPGHRGQGRRFRRDATDVHARGLIRRERIRPVDERWSGRRQCHQRVCQRRTLGSNPIYFRRSTGAVEVYGELHWNPVRLTQIGLVRRARLQIGRDGQLGIEHFSVRSELLNY